ncbi:MAG: hypothetical protein IPP33_09500 [Flavobacteriales bacterium]|nr:hypothetical protein [Flavobacteriales bacterium]
MIDYNGIVPVTPYCQNGWGGSAYVDGWSSGAFFQESIELWKDGQLLGTVVPTNGETGYQFTDLMPGNYTAYCTTFDFQGWPGQCGVAVSSFTINDLGPDCGPLEGNVWVRSGCRLCVRWERSGHDRQHPGS